VGALAVQLAKRRGATVVASCSPEKHDFVRELGADHVLDSRGDFLKALKIAVGEVDVILEMVGGGEHYKKNLAALAPLGRMIVYGAASGDTRGQIEPIGLMGKNLTVTGYYLTPMLDRRDLCETPLAGMARAVAADALRVEIGGRYSLAEGARAFEALESRGTRGKILLVP
jgi:NADPH2:quinone reductase